MSRSVLWRAALGLVVMWIISMILVSVVMERAKRNAEVNTRLVYTADTPAVLRQLFGSEAYTQFVDQEASFGDAGDFEIVHTLAQISGRPAICRVRVRRAKGVFVEELHWYGSRCLKISFTSVSERIVP